MRKKNEPIRRNKKKKGLQKSSIMAPWQLQNSFSQGFLQGVAFNCQAVPPGYPREIEMQPKVALRARSVERIHPSRPGIISERATGREARWTTCWEDVAAEALQRRGRSKAARSHV